MKPQQEHNTTAWWQVGSMWLVLGFTAAALLGCAITIWIALQGSDVPPPSPIAEGAPALVPAMQARNAVADRSALFQQERK